MRSRHQRPRATSSARPAFRRARAWTVWEAAETRSHRSARGRWKEWFKLLKGGADVGGGSLRLDSHSCTDASAGHRYRGGNEFGPAFGDEVTVPVEKQKPNRNAFTIGFLLDCKLNYLHNIAT
jgi:hypothetical protein